MSRLALKNKAAVNSKFSCRDYHRCGICGRVRGFLRRLRMGRICFRFLSGQIGMPDAKVTWDGVMWQTTIHMAFILSAIGIAWVDKMMNVPAPHKPKH